MSASLSFCSSSSIILRLLNILSHASICHGPHPAWHGSPYFLLLRRGWQPFLQLQWIILRRLSGAAFIFIIIGTNLLSSSFQPQLWYQFHILSPAIPWSGSSRLLMQWNFVEDAVGGRHSGVTNDFAEVIFWQRFYSAGLQTDPYHCHHT